MGIRWWGSTVFKVLFQKSGVFWLQRRVREGEIVGKTACAIDQERHWSDGSEQEEAQSANASSRQLVRAIAEAGAGQIGVQIELCHELSQYGVVCGVDTDRGH